MSRTEYLLGSGTVEVEGDKVSAVAKRKGEYTPLCTTCVKDGRIRLTVVACTLLA